METQPTNGSSSKASQPCLDVAIVGGGIIGVMTALGLLRRGMAVTIYERADDWHEIGAAFAFTGVARECMQRLDPRVLEALRRVSDRSPNEYNRYWDGFRPRTKEAAENHETGLLFQLPERLLNYWGCLRSNLLLEMAKELPDGVVRFGKQLEGCLDEEGSNKVVLHFADGSTAEADLIIGCDGIYSSTRKILLGADNPASYASYAHKVVYRALVPMDGAIAALGPDKSKTQCAHMGPGAHIVSFPVNHGAIYNIFIFVHDPKEWPDANKMVLPSTRDEVSQALHGWGPHITELASLMPEELTKSAIFDTADHPVPTFASGRVCLAGDSAHASSPFHGAGASMGVEDALVLAELLTKATDVPITSRPSALVAALQAFSAVRIERSQWLVQSSREMGDLYEWRHPAAERDAVKIKAEFERRSKLIWDFDVDNMVAESKSQYEALLKAKS